MRKVVIGLVAAVVLAGVAAVLLVQGRNPCDVLVERDLFDVVMDFDESGARSTMEEAAEDAFAAAGMPREVDASDLEPIVRAQPSGNLIHVGVDGHWVDLATTQDDGFVWVERPRPCSILERPT